MSQNPFQSLFGALLNVSNCIQTHLSQFISFPHNNNPTTRTNHYPFPLFSLSSSSLPGISEPKQSYLNPANTLLLRPAGQPPEKNKAAGPVTKEELGRATWTLLHTLAAQYPEKPTRQQKKDVKELMAILSRMYPCKECADHFKEVLRVNPVQAGNQHEFSQWLCHVHNVVNRSLGKLVFPCERVDARWGKLDCEQRACDLQGDENPWE
ncbi:FAD-linked sulfhydryl oxidase ERV1 isoform X2 [Coffea eugenioides]|nr:FAD-linked sulfhydryl oxidase ERV1 isoform X2 [Coffea eugenioides]